MTYAVGVPLSRETLARRVADAMRQAGVAQKDLAAAIEMDPTALNKALTGRRGFRAVELALLAEHLQMRTDTLLADEDADPTPRPTIAAHAQAGMSPAAKEAVARAEQIHEVDSLLDEAGYPDTPLRLPEAPSGHDPVKQGETLAEAMRRHAGDGGDLPHEPDTFAGWVEETFGVDVCMTVLPSGLDGLALSCGRLRLALVSSSVAATRQRFTIAHELCHLVYSDGQRLTIDEGLFRPTPEEQRANAFAAALLVPAQPLRAATDGREVDDTVVRELLDRFRVSVDALASRMHHVGIVDAQGRDEIRLMESARIAARPDRLDELQARNGQRVPGRVLIRAMRAFEAGEIGVRLLATLLHADEEQLREELVPPRFGAHQPDEPDQPYVL